MADIPKSTGLRVIIVGGGVAGLTLANALQHADIDYVLLESRSVIAPQLGASIGLAPNGCRILEQLSCYGELEKLTEPLVSAGNHAENGDDIFPRYDGFQLVHTRTHYPLCFLDRQIVLRILAEHVLDQSKILLNKRLVKVDHSANGVTAYCADGSSYHGDTIAGADGVFSKVRQEMWRAADAEEPGKISEEEKNSMTAEYKCLYGISSPVAELPSGNYDITYKKDVSTMVITGKGGRVFWFLFSKMARRYKSGEIPRFTEADTEELVQQNLNLAILPQGLVKFGDIWKHRESYTLVATEEADYDHWVWGRFACLGDSVHKVTPNMGVGGMAAIESAAALANTIQALSIHNDGSPPSFEDVRRALNEYQRNRKPRCSEAIKAANDLTRLQALKGMKEYILVHYVLPYAGDRIVDMSCDGWIGAPLLNYLPPPVRSLNSTMPFNSEQGLSKKDVKLYRALRALPILLLSIWAFRTMTSVIPYETGAVVLQAGKISWGVSSSILIPEKFYPMKFFDDFVRGPTVVLAPSTMGFDLASSYQNFSFFPDWSLVYTIILIESARRANVFTPLRYPFLFGIASMHGIGIVTPFWCFLHYILSPISNFSASDMRLTDLRYTLSVLPVMVLGNYIPYLVAFLYPDFNIRHYGMWVWHLYPVWVSLGQWILGCTVMPNTMQNNRIHGVTRDIWPIRITVGSLAALSATVWIHLVFTAPFSLETIFVPYEQGLDTFIGGARALLQWDQVFFVLSSITWVLYMFADLKIAGMMQQRWITLLVLLGAGTLLLGSGATTALAWLWREEILATRRHKAAIVSGKMIGDST
ncbi:MAG: hypothetical protein Q9187_000161 [Circinaria calcarea]